MLRIFNYRSYKEYLSDWIKQIGGRGSLSRLANAAGCHRTYLSQVLNSKVELTLDHAANLALFFKFEPSEADYFLACVMYERATLKNAKNFFLKKMESIKAREEIISKRIRSHQRENISARSEFGYYYADHTASLVHLATSCPQTQIPEAISERFGLDKDITHALLDYLITKGLVKKEGSKYCHSGKSIHLDRKSPFTRMNHLNWRLHACNDSLNENSIHYTNIFSIGKNDLQKLKSQLLDFIENQSKEIHTSGSDEVIVFCCDLYSV